MPEGLRETLCVKLKLVDSETLLELVIDSEVDFDNDAVWLKENVNE